MNMMKLMSSDANDMEKLVSLMKESQYCVVLTGAGVSTLSGIPDFRGKMGLSRKFDSDRLFSIDEFRRDPSYFYDNSKETVYSAHEKQPNIIHRVLANLEREGLIKSIVTQNIDMLHQKAGSKKVIELHGSPALHRCLGCGEEFPYDDVIQIISRGEIPRCGKCSGYVKPQIVFYGEPLNQKDLWNAVQEAEKADLMLILGSSLVVNPAASLPLHTLRNKGRIAIVNNQPTHLDSSASLRYPDLEEVFRHLEGAKWNSLL
jgi:NAD-dependent deacetylase